MIHSLVNKYVLSTRVTFINIQEKDMGLDVTWIPNGSVVYTHKKG